MIRHILLLLVAFLACQCAEKKPKISPCHPEMIEASSIYFNDHILRKEDARLPEALSLIRHWNSCNPDSLEGLSLQARIHYSLKQYDSTLIIISEYSHGDREAAVSQIKAFAFKKLGQHDSLAHYAEKALKQFDEELNAIPGSYMAVLGRINTMYMYRGEKDAFDEIDRFAKEGMLKDTSEINSLKRGLKDLD